MNTTTQIAKHLKEVFFGGNWTCVNVRDTLADVTWEEATRKVFGANSIAVLLGHISYYITVTTPVLLGGALEGKDELSFTHPPINNADDWAAMQDDVWQQVEAFALLVAKLPDEVLNEAFGAEKYGSYYRNLHGIIEHTHYHLGQIVILKKILRQAAEFVG